MIAAALKAPSKKLLAHHRETVLILRKKGYSWRQVAAFLQEHGVTVDHAALYRHFKGEDDMTTISIPSAAAYTEALKEIRSKMSDAQVAMLSAHYHHPNRSITYTELGHAAGYPDNKGANLNYGKLGYALGTALGFTFADMDNGSDKFYSSAIGMGDVYAGPEFHLVMHHELAKALDELKWF
jgi:hypothetical protein